MSARPGMHPMTQSNPMSRTASGMASNSEPLIKLAQDVATAAREDLSRFAAAAAVVMQLSFGSLIKSAYELQGSCELVSSLCDALMWLMEEKALPEEHKDTLQKVVSSIGECNKAIRSFLDTGARVGLQDTSVLLRAVVSNIRVCKSCLLSDSWLLAVGPDHCKQAGAEFRQSLKDDVSKMLAVVVGHPEVWQPGNASAQQAGGALLSLFEMAAACADVISGKQGASDATQQLRSFATLNALWVALVGSLSAVHDDAVDLLASRPAGQLSAASVLAKALAQLDAARADFMASGSEAHLRVVRFWMQHYFRLAATHARASVMAFEPLLSATAAAHPLAARPGAPQKAVDACAAVIAPKLQQALVTAMSASAALGLLPCCLAALRASVAGPSTPSSPALHVACDLLAAADQAPPQLHAALLLALPEPLLAAAAPLLGRLAPVPSAGALPERLAAAWAHASTAAVAHAAGEAASTDATPTEPWEAAQRVLFRAAVTPLPGAAAVVAAVWTAVLSAAGPAVRSSHLALLSQSLLSLSASACAAFGGPRSSAACASAAQVATVIAALASAAPAPRGALTSVLNHLLPNATAGTGAAAAHCAPAAASSAPRDRRGVSHQPHCLFALATLLEEPGAPLGDLDEKELRGLGEILAAAASDQDEDPDTRRQALRSIRAMLRRAGSDVQGGRMQQRAERDGARCVAAAVRAIEGGGSGETPGGDLGAALRTVTAGVRVGARSETATIDGAWGLEECVARPEGMVAAVEAAGSGGALSDDQTQQVLQGAFRQGSRADPALRHLALLSAMEWRRRSGQSITDALPPGVLSRPDSGALSRAIAAHVKREERKDSQGEALGDAVSTALDVLATSLGAVSAQSLADLAALRPAALSVCAPGPFSLLAASEDVARAAASLQKAVASAKWKEGPPGGLKEAQSMLLRAQDSIRECLGAMQRHAGAIE